jgi:FlaA1/EpsC-like NDP-sugar epimerase
MRYRNAFLLAVQLGMIILSYILSFQLRFEFELSTQYVNLFYSSLPYVIIARLSAYYLYKIHLGSWRFVSVQDLTSTIKAVFLGSIIFIVLMVFVHSIEDYPRSVFILDTLLNISFIGGSRFAIRYFYENEDKGKSKILKNVIIAGAGKAGVLLLKEIRNNPGLGLRVAGFIDDNPYKKGLIFQGISVLGNTNDIPDLIKKYNIDEVYIAMPSAKYKAIAHIKEVVQEHKVNVKILPEVGKAIQNNDFKNYLHDVSCDELLGRKTIKFTRQSDYALMEHEIRNKAVVVTGAGGSIGSELSRQVAQFRPRLLILYERYENNLYYLDLELRKRFPDIIILPIIGDILNTEKFNDILKKHSVNLIYHAAAYKHVPLMEREPIEAVRNNVFGTLNVAKLASRNNVDKFVLISTDKAVNPANIMGTTKRIAELIIQGMNGGKTRFVAVRFGNVIGSNGSVIPLFKQQIAEGGPVTITHPDITRYFMSIPEAVQLVMTAGAMGKGGEIFLLDMGKPIKIVDIAKELIRRSGLEPGEDIDIIFTGLRPGEKLHEELYWQGEGIVPTENKKITMLKPNGNSGNHIFERVEALNKCIESCSLNDMIMLMREIVPESTLHSGNYIN